MKYAPILIPTMCRYEHFVRLIESLKINSWAKYTDIYIGLDYPPALKYEDGYKRICKYLENDFLEFASFNIIRHTHNVGSIGNMHSLYDTVFKKYDRFIRTDDDAEFSPNFIEYMDKCLTEYEDDPNIIAVSGYSYPLKWKVSNDCTIFKENFICPMWGLGFWINKFREVKSEIENGYLQKSLDYVFQNNLMDKMLNVSKDEYVNLCLSPLFKDTLASKMTDVSIRMYTAINNKYIISPTISKVRNWGFDGSGEYCGRNVDLVTDKITAFNYPYHLQTIDQSTCFDLILDSLNAVDANRRILDAFEVLSFRTKMKYLAKKYIYQILGKDIWFKLCELKSKK